MKGVHLIELSAVGSPNKVVSISFGERFSVIEGASDTGKSYIFECIDFLLGAKTPPETIPQANGYDQVRLRFRSLEGGEYTLTRDLTGGAAVLQRKGEVSVTLSAVHDPDNPNTISTFFLRTIGMPDHVIRTNDSGTKRTFSFRDFVSYLCIDEVRIIDKKSPISSNVKTKTADQRIFNLLLTGQDDAGVVSTPKPAELKIRNEAGIAVVDQLIRQLEQEIVERGKNVSNWRAALAETERAIEETIASLRSEQEQVFVHEHDLQVAHERIAVLERQVMVNKQLLARFSLLSQQYQTDLSRLAAISEVGHYFAQLQLERCPTCGALPEHHDASAAWHLTTPASINEVKQAAVAEADKIRLLARKLFETISALEAETEVMQKELSDVQEDYVAVQQKLQDILTPRAQSVALRFEALATERSSLHEIETLYKRLEHLQRSRETLPISKKANKGAFGLALPSVAAIEEFNLVVEALLLEWGLPEVGRVTFHDGRSDLVIGGKHRGAAGKGVRAIAYAAFVIGLMQYCQLKGLPHPGFVVLDSPLVTYQKPDARPDDVLPPNVVENFYRSLAQLPSTQQVIVFENEKPPEDVLPAITYTHFSKSTEGRYGFFPILSNE